MKLVRFLMKLSHETVSVMLLTRRTIDCTPVLFIAAMLPLQPSTNCSEHTVGDVMLAAKLVLEEAAVVV